MGHVYISVNLVLLDCHVSCSDIFLIHAIMIFNSCASCVGDTVTKALAGMLEAKQ